MSDLDETQQIMLPVKAVPDTPVPTVSVFQALMGDTSGMSDSPELAKTRAESDNAPDAPEPSITEPPAVEPPATEPSAVEPATVEPVRSEPPATEPSADQPIASESAAGESGRAEQTDSGSARSQPPATESASSDSTASERSAGDSARSERAVNPPAGDETSGGNPADSEPAVGGPSGAADTERGSAPGVDDTAVLDLSGLFDDEKADQNRSRAAGSESASTEAAPTSAATASTGAASAATASTGPASTGTASAGPDVVSAGSEAIGAGQDARSEASLGGGAVTPTSDPAPAPADEREPDSTVGVPATPAAPAVSEPSAVSLDGHVRHAWKGPDDRAAVPAHTGDDPDGADEPTLSLLLPPPGDTDRDGSAPGGAARGGHLAGDTARDQPAPGDTDRGGRTAGSGTAASRGQDQDTVRAAQDWHAWTPDGPAFRWSGAPAATSDEDGNRTARTSPAEKAGESLREQSVEDTIGWNVTEAWEDDDDPADDHDTNDDDHGVAGGQGFERTEAVGTGWGPDPDDRTTQAAGDGGDFDGAVPPDPAVLRPRRRRRTVVLSLVAVVIVAAVVAGIAIVAARPKAPTGPPPAAGPAIPAAGPALSAYPDDAPLPTAAGLAAALAGPMKQKNLGGHVSVQVGDLATGKVLYGYNRTSPTTPASTMKLATTLAVLATRGPNYRITTRVVAGPHPGEVVIVGADDATLAAKAVGTYADAASVQGLAAQVRSALGTTKPTKVIVDTSLFPGPTKGPGWEESDVQSQYLSRVYPLSTDGGRINPANHGDAPRYADSATSAGKIFAKYLGLPAKAVTSGIAPKAPVGHVSGLTPGALLGSVQSPPLVRTIENMLSLSDNMLAESMARQVAIATGYPASFSGAAAAVTHELTKLGMPMQGVHIVDGSGISHQNRLTPALLSAIIHYAAEPDHPQFHAMFTGLPVAAYSGTLVHRFKHPGTTAADGLVRAKTGTLNGVSALAGFLIDAAGRPLIIVVLTDKAPWTGAPAAIDKIGAAVQKCGCGSAPG